jgi:hypothetical protein
MLTRTCLDQKIKKDYHPLNKFLRYSWYELPRRASHSRLMKPACVVRATDADVAAVAKNINMKHLQNNPPRETKSKGGTRRTHKSPSLRKDSKLALYVGTIIPYLVYFTKCCSKMPYLTFATLPHNLNPKQKYREYSASLHANRRH